MNEQVEFCSHNLFVYHQSGRVHQDERAAVCARSAPRLPHVAGCAGHCAAAVCLCSRAGT